MRYKNAISKTAIPVQIRKFICTAVNSATRMTIGINNIPKILLIKKILKIYVEATRSILKTMPISFSTIILNEYAEASRRTKITYRGNPLPKNLYSQLKKTLA